MKTKNKTIPYIEDFKEKIYSLADRHGVFVYFVDVPEEGHLRIFFELTSDFSKTPFCVAIVTYPNLKNRPDELFGFVENRLEKRLKEYKEELNYGTD